MHTCNRRREGKWLREGNPSSVAPGCLTSAPRRGRRREKVYTWGIYGQLVNRIDKNEEKTY